MGADDPLIAVQLIRLTVGGHRLDLKGMLFQRCDQDNKKAGSSDGKAETVTLDMMNYSSCSLKY